MNISTLSLIWGAIQLLLGGLLGVLWRMVLLLYKELKDEVNILKGDMKLVEANCVGRDTLNKLDKDWRDKLEDNRMERKEQHNENKSRLDTISNTLTQVVELSVTLRLMQEEIRALRETKHSHADLIQSHEARLHFLEKG